MLMGILKLKWEAAGGLAVFRQCTQKSIQAGCMVKLIELLQSWCCILQSWNHSVQLN